MPNKQLRRALALILVLAAFTLACRASGAFAQFALDGLSLPAMRRLQRLAAPVPFPIAEPLALILAAGLSLTLLHAVLRAAASRSSGPLRRWLAGLAWTALLLGGALIVLWGPAREAPVDPAPSIPDAERLEWLCGQLIDGLNQSELRFPDPGEALRLAPEVAGHPGLAVKAARYPEWMGAARLSGLYVPLTGEALVDATAPAPLIPFTAVHELAHAAGIADEGAANIAAWERCLSAEGEFADSARLWALRYALGLLRRADEAAWRRASAKMEGALTRTFQICGGEANPAVQAPFSAALLPLSRGDYAALAGYLIENGV